MRNSTLLFCLLFSISSCSSLNHNNDKQNAIQGIEKAEADFAKLAADSGIHIAFTHYAHDSAIVKTQKDSLIKGIAGISNFYNNPKLKNVQLTWKPDFVDAAASGELGYTYGKYNYDLTDSVGKHTVYKGIFHTVWKKNEAGEWKFVWD